MTNMKLYIYIYVYNMFWNKLSGRKSTSLKKIKHKKFIFNKFLCDF